MKALLIMDMINDFCHKDGALYFPKGEEIIPEVKQVIEKFVIETLNFGNKIFVCDNHEKNDKEFERFPKHGVADTWGADIVSELQYCLPSSNIVKKKRYGGFFNTELEKKLEGIDEVWIVGVCTEICVMFTVEELCNRDIKTKVFKKAVASFNEERHKFALDVMENVLGAEIVE